ncbi:MAG TPA: 50S ribosomal protein L10 [Nitrososphaeraceae archaeon]|jgi:large subunit ribosomal protein L10|nr:50S ribosomal protein L10 [Nitrososphaeraceae archaeon]
MSKTREKRLNNRMVSEILRTEGKRYPKKKRIMYSELQELPRNYDVIALSKMTKVRATQLMMIRKKLRNDIKILIIKNKVAQRAFEKIKDVRGLESLSKELEGQCGLIFTQISPFKLNLIFDQNKVLLPAKGGDIASKQISIPAGNTGITPGPVLSEFKEANVPTKIDQGSIWVSRDTVIARQGEVISQKLASLMSKLNIKPIEAGITLNFAIAAGLVLRESDLKINLEEYHNEMSRSFQEALALAMEAGYITSETIVPLLLKAHQKATALSSESGYISKDTIGLVIPMAQSKALTVGNEAKKRGYEPY